MSERQGVEIDYCPTCRGVWLDRGELDKIVERSHAELVALGGLTAPAGPARPVPPVDPDRYGDRRYDEGRRRYDDDRRYGKPKKKKRTSFLEDIFDF